MECGTLSICKYHWLVTCRLWKESLVISFLFPGVSMVKVFRQKFIFFIKKINLTTKLQNTIKFDLIWIIICFIDWFYFLKQCFVYLLFKTMLKPNWNAAETLENLENLSKFIFWKLLRTSHQSWLSFDSAFVQNASFLRSMSTLLLTFSPRAYLSCRQHRLKNLFRS